MTRYDTIRRRDCEIDGFYAEMLSFKIFLWSRDSSVS